MSLKLYRISTGIRDRVDKRMRLAETPVVRLSNLCNDEAFARVLQAFEPRQISLKVSDMFG